MSTLLVGRDSFMFKPIREEVLPGKVVNQLHFQGEYKKRLNRMSKCFLKKSEDKPRL